MSHVIKEMLNKISGVFAIKKLGPLESFVGCHITMNEKKETIWVSQPKLIGHLKEKFADKVPKKEVKIPAGSGFTVMRPREGDVTITDEDQSVYRTGVGMLLYLVKLSRPEISNATRELTKVLQAATENHYKGMLRVIKYIFETENIALKLKPILKNGMIFQLHGYCDSDYAGDKDTRISVFGYILYFCGCPISWKSKSGRSVTLSSTEAEYVAISELAKEVMFVKQLLESLGFELEYPIIIHVDNVSAIYLAYNHSISQRTKHMDCRMHYVREYVEDNILKVVFVSTDNNVADVFTKNTPEKIFKRHVPKFLAPLPGSDKNNKWASHSEDGENDDHGDGMMEK